MRRPCSDELFIGPFSRGERGAGAGKSSRVFFDRALFEAGAAGFRVNENWVAGRGKEGRIKVSGDNTL